MPSRIFSPPNLPDKRADLLATYEQQGADPRALTVLRTYLDREAEIVRLRDEHQPEARAGLRHDVRTQLEAVLSTIEQETQASATRQAHDEARATASQPTTPLDPNDLAVLGQTPDVGVIGDILDRARRISPTAARQATAIALPRVRELVAEERGYRGLGGSREGGPAFRLFVELQAGSVRPTRSASDTARQTFEQRKRQVLGAAGTIDPELPRLITAAALKRQVASQLQIGSYFDGPKR